MPFIPKIALNKLNGEKIKLRDYLKYDLIRVRSTSYDFNKNNKATFVDNSSDEIKNLAIECHKKYNNSLVLSNEDQERQDLFWRIVRQTYPNNFNPDVKTLISPYFLKKHEYIIN